MRRLLSGLTACLGGSLPPQGLVQHPVTPDTYESVIARTAAMVGDARAQQLAAKHGLQVLNVTWEDTGRFKGSAVGPNISDMTIQVQHPASETKGDGSARFALTCMPVIRYPNFSDKTADLRLDRFFLLVGNEKGERLRRVTLGAFLEDLRAHLGDPASWKGERRSLLAGRDSHVLVSAQACFLPIPARGKSEFNPVLFNYQSYEGDPAVLTVLVTREGASVTVIDNKRDAFAAGPTWGQRLFFNKGGQRAVLAAERLSDFQAGGGDAAQPDRGATAAGESGLDMVLLVQVPLKQRAPRPRPAPMAADPLMDFVTAEAKSDVENAVIGHGRVEGPFTEIAGLPIERDDRFPLRVTVQFYKATSNGVVSESDMADIARQIGRVYADADYVGSLVTEGETLRPTEHAGEKTEPPHWWAEFWARHEVNTGMTAAQAIAMLRRLYGPNWADRPRDELARALKQRP